VFRGRLGLWGYKLPGSLPGGFQQRAVPDLLGAMYIGFGQLCRHD